MRPLLGGRILKLAPWSCLALRQSARFQSYESFHPPPGLYNIGKPLGARGTSGAADAPINGRPKTTSRVQFERKAVPASIPARHEVHGYKRTLLHPAVVRRARTAGTLANRTAAPDRTPPLPLKHTHALSSVPVAPADADGALVKSRTKLNTGGQLGPGDYSPSVG